jgi:hypothetical protein
LDAQLFLRVVWRFRLLVTAGLVFALALAFLAFVRVSFEDSISFSYRDKEQWAAYSTLLVTQEGFPEGRLVVDPVLRGDVEQRGNKRLFADPNRLNGLAVLYANLADSDPVKRLMRRGGPIRGRIEAASLTASDNPSNVLPLIQLAGVAETRAAALELTHRGTTALVRFVEGEQHAAAIPDEERVILRVVKNPGRAKVLSARSKAIPILVFLTVAVAFLGLAFVLENLRPLVPRSSDVRVAPAPAETPRLSA